MADASGAEAEAIRDAISEGDAVRGIGELGGLDATVKEAAGDTAGDGDGDLAEVESLRVRSAIEGPTADVAGEARGLEYWTALAKVDLGAMEAGGGGEVEV